MAEAALRLYKRISSSPLPPRVKFGMVKTFRNAVYALRRDKSKHACLIMSNEGYGHEYWLRLYSGYESDIYAQIEHGVYFGRNTSPSVNVIPDEWEIGSFITFGEYRRSCILSHYPDSRIETIGPYIQYAETDEGYLKHLQSMIDLSKRTLVVFPAHSVSCGHVIFDHVDLIEKCKWYAAEREFSNLVVCLSPMDMGRDLALQYEQAGFVIATCGSDQHTFLPRQRAIFRLADITVSNAMGTHIGYSIAMGVPHRFVSPVSLKDKVRGNCIAPGVDLGTLRLEREEFLSAFLIDDGGSEITASQKDLYGRYWGGGMRKTPEEMRRCLEGCRERYRRHKGKVRQE